MSIIKKIRLNLLRASYIFVSLGLAYFFWPEIIAPDQRFANSYTVINALLGAVGLLAVIGIWYPLKMLPILLFELIWKVIWVLAFALPTKMSTGLDAYAEGSLFDCYVGIIIMLITIPWDYVYKHYIKIKAEENTL